MFFHREGSVMFPSVIFCSANKFQNDFPGKDLIELLNNYTIQ